MRESDWTCTRRFSDGSVRISEGIRIRGRNIWKRFQRIASTIIFVINNRVMTWLRLNPRRWFIYSATFDCPWKMLPTNYSPLFHIGEHYFLEENVAQPHLKDISISSGKMHLPRRLGRVRSLRRIHVRNLHFPCLATHYGTEIDRRVRIPSTAYERVVRKWNDDVSRKDPPALSPRCRPPPFVYHSVDRFSSTSLAGNTNRVAKITLMSQAYREREKTQEKERWEQRGWHRVW